MTDRLVKLRTLQALRRAADTPAAWTVRPVEGGDALVSAGPDGRDVWLFTGSTDRGVVAALAAAHPGAIVHHLPGIDPALLQ